MCNQRRMFSKTETVISKYPNILNHSDVCLAKLCDNFDNSIFRSVSFKCWAKMFQGFFSGHIRLLR